MLVCWLAATAAAWGERVLRGTRGKHAGACVGPPRARHRFLGFHFATPTVSEIHHLHAHLARGQGRWMDW